MKLHSLLRKFLPVSAIFACCVSISTCCGEDLHAGPAYDRYRLTLMPGERTEAAGPIYGFETTATNQSLMRISPLFSIYRDESIPQVEYEFLYPILTYDRFGPEYRFQFFQVFSFSGGQNIKTMKEKRRFTLFPFYFQQRSPIPEENYTALVPFYGHLKNRLFRDQVFFILLPIYLQTVKRDVVTDNYLVPFFDVRHGNGLKGWQFWPLVGHETKAITQSTNIWGEVETVPGHKKFFTLWPFYFNNTLGIGTTNLQHQFVLLPFYTSQDATNRVSKSYGFPIGVTHTIDREKKYEEWGAPWPLVDFAHGEGKTAKRIWPFFGQAKNPILESDFYLWPVYKYNRATSDPLDRERTRILFFLYSDIDERNTATGKRIHRIDQWPFFTYRKDRENNERLQILALLEPLLPNNKSVERLYSPVWSIWRAEKNAKTGTSSKSLLWNLYRSEHTREKSSHAVFFGLVQHEKDKAGTKWKILFIPFGGKRS